MTKDNFINNSYKIVIIGGGPSGVATALTLNALGISNCIIEASNSPRQKFGEAIPPNAKPLLKQLGILNLVENEHHLKYYGNQSNWGSDILEQKEFISEIHGHGYLLNRLHFEKQLWTLYQENGGHLFTNTSLKKVEQTSEGIKLTTESNGKQLLFSCTFVVDATGRKSSVCRQLGIPKINLDQQFSLSFSIKSAHNIEHQIIVEATEKGWWYMSPNGNYNLSLMFFTHKELLPDRSETTSFLINVLNESRHISQFVTPNSLKGADVKTMVAGTSRLEIPYGDNWIAVGDSAFAYDPISSYGITSGLASGYYAGQALASKMAGKEEAMDAYRYIVENAFQAYLEKLDIHYKIEQRWPNSFYWKNRFSTQ